MWRHYKQYVCAVISLVLMLTLIGCDRDEKNTIKVGAIAGPEAQLLETAQQVAKTRYGLNIKIISFSDYNTPNIALNDGSIDANMFQHLPFLEQQIAQRHYDIVDIGKTFIYPMGLYSKKIKSLADLHAGSHIAIPNDPSNETRALQLLQAAKLIELDPEAGFNATPLNIVSNPYQLVFSVLDGAQLPRSLNDVDLAAINTNYAIPAGLSPVRDALFLEDKNSPYADIIVVRIRDKNDPRLAQLVAALHSKEVLEKARQIFGDDAIPAFSVQSSQSSESNQH